jgi:hypothetical protein
MKIIRIISSRFIDDRLVGEAAKRYDKCRRCEFMVSDYSKMSFKQKVYYNLSNLLTFITKFKLNDDNSACGICGCTIKYKVIIKEEKCPKNKWK